MSGAGRRLEEAIALHRAGRLDAAEAAYRDALAAAPGSYDALRLLGMLLGQRGAPDEGIPLVRQAIARDPGAPKAHSNLGTCLQLAGRHEEALAAYDAALALDPSSVPDRYNRARALQMLGRLDQALGEYDAVLAARPDDVEALNNRGLALAGLNRYQEAIASYDRALALASGHAPALNNRGLALAALRRQGEAVQSFRRAIALDRRFAEAHHNLAITLKAAGELEQALAHDRAALALDPQSAQTLIQLVSTAAQMCAWDAAAPLTERLLAACEAPGFDASPFPLLSLADEPELHLTAARRYRRNRIVRSPPLWSGERYGHPRIRVAYLSGDFRRHAIGYLTAELLESHDRDAFEIAAFSFGQDDGSDVRARIADGVDRFVDARGLSDREAAEALRALEIDIAVDLMGYTRGCRPDILASRPAPVQVSWLGYPGTMGAEFIDYIVADRFVIPEGAEAAYSEAVVRLPDCYQPNDRRRAIAEATPSRAAAGLPERGFVFCCFNNSYKITRPVFEAWMRMLRAVPGSVLWLIADNRWAETNLRRAAAGCGIDPARLVFAPRVSLAEHLARHRLADLFVDTLPYGAHTTASDALWAGLPLVTCAGRSFAARVAGSLLHAVGLPELATSDLAAYEALAVALARDPARLAALAERLATLRATAPLFDTPRFRRHLEHAYGEMRSRAERGEAPRAISVRAT